MDIWEFLVFFLWCLAGMIIALLVRRIFKRKSSFGYFGDALLGGVAGLAGGYYMAHEIAGSKPQGFLITLGAAALVALLTVWLLKFITKP